MVGWDADDGVFFYLDEGFSIIIMFQKENQGAKAGPSRRDRKAAASKLTEGGNDYILKRYKLEENKLFKQKQNEELKYEMREGKRSEDEEQEIEEVEDELVIVPLELPNCQQEQPVENHASKKQEFQDIFVFDDEEEQEDSQPVYTYSEGQKFSIQDSKKEYEQQRPHHEDQISLKGTHRGNYSTAELITPKAFELPKKKSDADPNERLEKLCRDQQNVEEQGIQCLKGVKIGKESSSKAVSITITDKKVFSISKLPSGIILQCIIKRTSSILNLLSPQFDLYLANGLKHILSAKKYPLRNRQLFKFSTDPLKFNDDSQLAVMHANVNHNIYWVLDQPRRIGGLDLSFIYLVIGYYKIKSQEKHQRKFTALLPPTNKSEYQLAMDYQLSNINFGNIKQQIKTEISNLQKWPNQSYNSTKNFVLADDDDPDYRYLQMKKQSDDVFELTIQHPLSPLQAMAIAMTRFDVQLK